MEVHPCRRKNVGARLQQRYTTKSDLTIRERHTINRIRHGSLYSHVHSFTMTQKYTNLFHIQGFERKVPIRNVHILVKNILILAI